MFGNLKDQQLKEIKEVIIGKIQTADKEIGKIMKEHYELALEKTRHEGNISENEAS